MDDDLERYDLGNGDIGRDEAKAILALPEAKQKPAFMKIDPELRPHVLIWLRALSNSGGPNSKGFVLMAVTDDENGQSDAITYAKRNGLTKNDVAIKRAGGVISVVRIRDVG